MTKARLSEPLGIRLETFEDVWAFADCLAKGMCSSGSAGKHSKTAHECVAIIQAGAEVGLPPMAAINDIYLLNGRACAWGVGILAICYASPLFIDNAHEEWFELDAVRVPEAKLTDPEMFGKDGRYRDGFAAVCKVHRQGQDHPRHMRFSVVDATHAGLWKSQKTDTYQKYSRDMLMSKARNRLLKLVFADVIKGIAFREDFEAVAQPEGDAATEFDEDAARDQLTAAPEPPAEPKKRRARKKRETPPADTESGPDNGGNTEDEARENTGGEPPDQPVDTPDDTAIDPPALIERFIAMFALLSDDKQKHVLYKCGWPNVLGIHGVDSEKLQKYVDGIQRVLDEANDPERDPDEQPPEADHENPHADAVGSAEESPVVPDADTKMLAKGCQSRFGRLDLIKQNIFQKHFGVKSLDDISKAPPGSLAAMDAWFKREFREKGDA